MSDSPDFYGPLLTIGGGIILVCFIGCLAGTNTLGDLFAALFAAYMLLRITTAMDSGSSKRRRR